MRYITLREEHRYDSLAGLFLAILGIIALTWNLVEIINTDRIFTDYDIFDFQIEVLGIVLGGGFFGFCWSDRYIRRKYYEKGCRFDAVIIGAEHQFNGRGEDFFWLIIEFYDGERRLVRKTPRYLGNPNNKLQSVNCSVYKWNRRYMEGDFQILDKEIKNNLSIPIVKYRHLQVKGKEYV